MIPATGCPVAGGGIRRHPIKNGRQSVGAGGKRRSRSVRPESRGHRSASMSILHDNQADAIHVLLWREFFMDYSNPRTSAASGGSASTTECGCPCHGIGSLGTSERVG